MHLLTITVKEFIPLKVCTINPKDKAWMTVDIKTKLMDRDKAYKRWRSKGTDYYHNMYKARRTDTNVSILEAKANHFNRMKDKLVNSNAGSKEYWHIIKSLYGNKINSGIPAIIDNEIHIQHQCQKLIFLIIYLLKNQSYLVICLGYLN